MRKTRAFFAIAALTIPTLAIAQKVSYDYDKTANFAAFKTYTLKDGTKVGQPLIDNRIVAAIESQLAERGLTRNDSNPDLFVVYHVAFDKEKDIYTYSSGAGGYGAYGWGWGGGWAARPRRKCATSWSARSSSTWPTRRRGRSRGAAWASRKIDTQAKPEKRDKSINNAVKKIFKNFPPKTQTDGRRDSTHAWPSLSCS